jgi:signal peptidase I
MSPSIPTSEVRQTAAVRAGLLTAAIIGADQATKFGGEHLADAFPSLFTSPVLNPEFTLGIVGVSYLLTMVMAVAVLVGFGGYVLRAASVGRVAWWVPPLLIGGAVSNLIDRALFGAVRDFVLTAWVILNVADVVVVVGVVAFGVGVAATRRVGRPPQCVQEPLHAVSIETSRHDSHGDGGVASTGVLCRPLTGQGDVRVRELQRGSAPRPDQSTTERREDPDGVPVAADRTRRRARAASGSPRWAFFRELPFLLVLAFTLAFLLRVFVLQVFFVPSGSMLPTLQVDDRIVVEKLSYLLQDPERGDVVVFADGAAMPPDDGGSSRVWRGVGQFLGVIPMDARDLVKRIIGTPGDTVALEDGRVLVNGVLLDEPYAWLDRDNGRFEVPEGKLFVLGDNRAHSGDSRGSLGLVDRDDIVGRVVFRPWPLDRLGRVGGGDVTP